MDGLTRLIHGPALGLLRFVFLIASFACISGCQKQQLFHQTRLLLGTYVEVISPRQEAAPIVFAEIARIEHLLSKYDPQSEISQLNATGKIIASAETFYVISKAKEFWINSGGVFDVTVGPLLDLWGFTDKHFRVPCAEDIQRALQTVGMDKVVLDSAQHTIEFTRPGVKVDLGAIAKGYAVDCAVAKLTGAGIRSCLIRAGGQINCLGDKYGMPWKVAIQDPFGAGIQGLLPALRDKAVATSGNYEQRFSEHSKQYGHIFDPRTGYPAETGVASVTVVASDGLTADALSTSLFILGPVKGEVMASRYPGVWWKVINQPRAGDPGGSR